MAWTGRNIKRTADYVGEGEGMFDQEGYEHYMRRKISLENLLEEIGDFRGSKEVEMQMRLVDDRLLAKLKQDYRHSMQEMDGLRFVLMESIKERT